MQQTTFDDALPITEPFIQKDMPDAVTDPDERQWHIDRLEASLARWRSTNLDKILADDYADYVKLLDYMKAGGQFRITTWTPEKALANYDEFKASELGQMFREIGEGLARISRTAHQQTNRRERRRVGS